ncbi:hypothetical protein [Haloarchaeobius sp. HME9146]|uniref:hypothetical protein n=1 Tax=Haloarchaeobius sp. HME9146 TaxID=2978732 RepID=UPI0021C0BB3F|nr:hypothetical protein [Haloarchaeobius sp. HME9146]MCT9098020.1 hypothetical protein [Haloarchaeobius sp. HME9146]
MTARRSDGPTVTTDGNRFRLDGELVDLWGIRTASATATDEQCQHLIDQLDDYTAHGVNAVTVFYMGCMGANYDPFAPDGSSIDPDHRRRMERIAEACAARDMVLVVGVFYQFAPFGLRDANAVHEALGQVARHLEPYRNVIVNVANEHSSYGWDQHADAYDFRDPDNIVECCSVLKETDPDRLVGGGGFHPETTAVIGRADTVDVCLFDTGEEIYTDNDSGAMHDRLVRAGVRDKPLVNVELFGGWTERFPRGVFPPDARLAYGREVQRAAARPGLSVFFHNNRWCQHPELPMRYDLAGQGTAGDPGIRWYFEQVRAAQERTG